MDEYKYGIFDVDGTLIDNMSASADAFADTLVSNGFDIPREEAGKLHLETAGTQLNDQMRMILDVQKVSFDESVINKLNEDFFVCRENLKSWQEAKVFPKAKDVFSLLYDKEIKIFLTSGSQAEGIMKSMKQFGLNKYIHFMMGGYVVPKGPKHIEEFAKLAGLSVEEFSKRAFYCGDGARDMEIAKMSGIYAIGVAQTVSKEKLFEAGADAVVDEIVEVIGLDILK